MTILDDARPGFDPQIRVQDDLFGHANGGWLASSEIPADKASWGGFVVLSDAAEAQVRTIVEECAQSGADAGEEARKIGDLYASFMDEDRAEELGHTPILPLLEQIRAIEDVAGLCTFLGSFERRGGSGVFGSYVDIDATDPDKYLVNLTQGGIGLPDESYYREEKRAEVRAKYQEYLAHMLRLAQQPDPEDGAARVVALETRIAQGHWERSETREVLKTYNPHTWEELTERLPAFDFGGWITALGGDPETLAESVVRQPSYLTHLGSVLAETPIEDWRLFLTVRAIRTAAPYLSSDFVAANFDFYGRTLAGTPELRARWKRGISLVEGALGEAVGRLYVERHFPARSKQMMDELVANLLEAYRRSITDLDWMSEETKLRAFAKLDTFRPKIGYPEKFRDYSALEITVDDLLGNVLATTAFETDRELRKIGTPVDRDEWLMLPQTVNAYYYPSTNEICFPAAILHKPFFDADAEAAENYGAIGAVIGHEIGHGFDDQGAQYDGDGRLHDWWTAADKEAFQERSRALIEQYDGLEPRDLPGERVQGALTVGENIGDLGGITIALKAYLLSLGDDVAQAEEADENGLTGVQRLFLSWAQAWRTKRREQLATQLLATDPHSPPEFRANIVRNLTEFHEAFETRPGDGLWLEPDQRVRIW